MTYRKQKMLGLLLLLASGLSLRACATEIPSSVQRATTPPSEFCLIAKPLTWSPKDTDETIASIKRFNCIGSALCAWGGAPEAATCK
jgi:hypothetical protein